MFLTFHETLTLYIALDPSVFALFSYKFVVDTKRMEIGVYKSSHGTVTEMKNETFSQQYHEKKMLFFIHRSATQWEIGHSAGAVTVADSTSLKMKFWGIACSSVKPVKLTFWKHIGT
jgi:hypothetical protein